MHYNVNFKGHSYAIAQNIVNAGPMVCVSQLLWEKEREERGLTKKQTFIDLGCGNGLLVYLLTSEGVSEGTKIWSLHTTHT